MRKQPIIFVLAAVIIVALGVITFAIYISTLDNEPSNSQQSNVAAEQRALGEARTFEPPEGTMCTMVMTPAVHTETGVTHTFTSGCLPDGWEKAESPGDSPRAHEQDNQTSASSNYSDNSLQPGHRDDGARPPSSPSNSEIRSSDPTGSRGEISPEERALREARSFRPGPDIKCTQVLTPATHKETGVKYTFPTGCIPEGWVRDDDRTPRFNQ